MKKILLSLLLIAAIKTFGQTNDTLVQWTFPDSAAAVAPFSDDGLPVNIGIPIVTAGTAAISYSFTGATTWCARATGWDNGSGTKYWLINFSSKNYNTLKLSSKQKSSGTGPRDFKVQYTTSLLGSWTDVPSATVLDSNDWTHGVLSNIAIPAACDNQDSVYLRWIMTSNTSVLGATVASAGPSRIDDIFVTGNLIPAGISSFSQPKSISIIQNQAENRIIINSAETMAGVTVFDVLGNLVFKSEAKATRFSVDASSFRKGIYIVKVRFADSGIVTRKISF